MRRALPDNQIAVGYVRVSTEDQKLGPEAQRSALASLASREGVRLVAVCEDQGVSGAAPVAERPGLVAALGAVREHRAGALVVARADRLARDTWTALTIERVVAETGARVLSADGVGNGTTPADELLRTILAGAATYERAIIAQRTRDALAAKTARGETRGGVVPYGFRLAEDGRVSKKSGRPCGLEPDPAEQAVIGQVRALAAEGLGFGAIARRLTELGAVTRTGRPFHRVQVARILGHRAS